MRALPVIRRWVGIFPCKRGGPKVPVTHKVPRVVPPFPPNTDRDVIQDEAGFPVLDEDAGAYIFDDYKA